MTFTAQPSRYEWSTAEEVITMCKAEEDNICEHPEKLKGKPGECSTEQIRECHGDVKEHPCVSTQQVN